MILVFAQFFLQNVLQIGNILPNFHTFFGESLYMHLISRENVATNTTLKIIISITM